MNRHSIIGLLPDESTDNIDVVQNDSCIITVKLVEDEKCQLANGLGPFLQQLLDINLMPNNVAIELLIIATLVTLADTRISRELNSQDSWSREIDLYVPVEDVSQWQNNSELLCTILNFLSGDRWRVFFRKSSHEYSRFLNPTQQKLINIYDSVALFSGGLDSFIGAVDLLSNGKKPIFVSHYWDTLTPNYQNLALSSLAKTFKQDSFRQIKARIGFNANYVSKNDNEKTLRARSFLFFALAVCVVSTMDGHNIIIIPENGLISLNVPLTYLRLGTLSTKTTHPFYMKKFEELINNLGITAKFNNPYRFKTKGEMIRECKNFDFLKNNISNTISCSSPSAGRFKGESLNHCGHCIPCIIRQAAIRSVCDDKTIYNLNIFSKTLNSSLAEGRNIRAFKLAINRVKNASIDKLICNIKTTGSFKDYSEAEIIQYAELYKRGMLEVQELLNDVKVQ